MRSYCQSCGFANEYSAKNCSSCNEPFNKIEPPKQSSARIIPAVNSREEIDEFDEKQLLKQFDFSCFAEELEQEIKNNSGKALNKSITMDDILKGK